MSFFISLVENSDAGRRALEEEPRIHAMIHHGLRLDEYRAFLHDLYHIVWHFCPVMAAAAARCGDEFREVRYALYERIEEEKGHEGWVLEDIEAMGGDVVAAGREPPSYPVQAMIAYNYYAVERLHPCSVLGMLYMLEVISSVYGGRVSDSIARALGREVAAGGFKFLSSHATMDVDHMASLNRLLKTVADPAAQAAIIRTTNINFHQFGQIFRPGGSLAPA
ncbi:MAG: iron-containing redox enzyme family protein [Betaproteobacteria bacterium]|nr:iron-containing redox enzyme family protein [Betaproteobacteria bacterium]MDH5221008.1 iron-containing redox enzyme family protein [Betaproteobacteria bacterium]MDH5350283.1 iron-containing redox enzyme family protein [Betaproteobacteria bacterium]